MFVFLAYKHHCVQLQRAVQGKVAKLDGDVSAISVAETPADLALVSFRKAPPVLLSADGSVRPLPEVPAARTFAALGRRGRFVALATDKGLVVLLSLKTLKLLDAMQVRIPLYCAPCLRSLLFSTVCMHVKAGWLFPVCRVVAGERKCQQLVAESQRRCHGTVVRVLHTQHSYRAGISNRPAADARARCSYNAGGACRCLLNTRQCLHHLVHSRVWDALLHAAECTGAKTLPHRQHDRLQSESACRRS
jgi:hypothetical protein